MKKDVNNTNNAEETQAKNDEGTNLSDKLSFAAGLSFFIAAVKDLFKPELKDLLGIDKTIPLWLDFIMSILPGIILTVLFLPPSIFKKIPSIENRVRSFRNKLDEPFANKKFSKFNITTTWLAVLLFVVENTIISNIKYATSQNEVTIIFSLGIPIILIVASVLFYPKINE